MLKEIARVTRTSERHAWVSAQRKSGCGGCDSSTGCGVSIVDRMFSPRETEIRIMHDNAVKPGDLVEVGIEESAFIRSSMLVYLLPLLMMLGFAIFGHWLHGQEVPVDGLMRYNDVVVMLYAFAGLLAGFYCVYIVSGKLANHSGYQAVFLKKIENYQE